MSEPLLRNEIAEIIIVSQYINYVAPAAVTGYDHINLKKDAVDMYLGKASKKWNSLQVCRFHGVCEQQINLIMRAIAKAQPSNTSVQPKVSEGKR